MALRRTVGSANHRCFPLKAPSTVVVLGEGRCHPVRGVLGKVGSFNRCPRTATPKTRFAHPAIDTADPVWVAEYNVIDALVAPLQAVIGKA